MNSENNSVKFAELLLQATPIISNPEEPEETMSLQTSSPSVGSATPGFTVSELEASLELLDEESTTEDDTEESLVFNSTLKQISKIDEGGYEIHFEVPENERAQVAALLNRGSGVFKLVIL